MEVDVLLSFKLKILYADDTLIESKKLEEHGPLGSLCYAYASPYTQLPQTQDIVLVPALSFDKITAASTVSCGSDIKLLQQFQKQWQYINKKFAPASTRCQLSNPDFF